MWVTRRIFTWVAANLFFLINLIERFKQNLHLKNYYNSTFLSWKTKITTFYCLKRKTTSIHPNEFASKKLPKRRILLYEGLSLFI